MSGSFHFPDTQPLGIPRSLCLVVLMLACGLGSGTSHALALPSPSGRQVRTALSTAVMSAAQEDRWREQEIQRYSPGQETNLLDGKNSDYIKLVVAPLLLFILALAVVRLGDF